MADQPAPPNDATADGISTTLGERTASATGIVDAAPSDVFDYLRRPANHAEISGAQSVKARQSGDEVLGPEGQFRMRMQRGPVPYRMRSKVVEFDENRVIAWCHFGGHRWRWELEPADDGKTKVTETFDGTTFRAPFVLKLMGLPKGHVPNVQKSVANVQRRFARS